MVKFIDVFKDWKELEEIGIKKEYLRKNDEGYYIAFYLKNEKFNPIIFKELENYVISTIKEEDLKEYIGKIYFDFPFVSIITVIFRYLNSKKENILDLFYSTDQWEEDSNFIELDLDSGIGKLNMEIGIGSAFRIIKTTFVFSVPENIKNILIELEKL